jgi:hypothetical protein
VSEHTATQELLDMIADESNTRQQVARVYALALGDETIGWYAVNLAIIDRWTLSGLVWIKRHAWKLRGRPATPSSREAER